MFDEKSRSPQVKSEMEDEGEDSASVTVAAGNGKHNAVPYTFVLPRLAEMVAPNISCPSGLAILFLVYSPVGRSFVSWEKQGISYPYMVSQSLA
ncbi:hypothetical protein L1987_76387 [Smallanthus sonchifolius]|uniref:Uncharacterized protein n=1 Tax=Smallanthus sonchifolius TaxID=185202 RepID=A0ACB9A821_9ASTR|nr:hypothetical protein L1987_76387 [Smallanthus sonchifolius]